jgi:hypothetical protein
VSRADVQRLREDFDRRLARSKWGEAAAVAVLLRFERISLDSRLAACTDQEGINWDWVLNDGTWSTNERFLLETAANLWNSRNGKVDLGQVYSLDGTFWRVWSDMVIAARSGRIPGQETTR